MSVVAPVTRPLACAIAASLSLIVDANASAVVAYGATAGRTGWEYVRIDFGTGSSEDIGSISPTLMVGAFVDNDYSKEYAIDYPYGDLYAIDVFTADTTLVGAVGTTPGQNPSGIHWNPASDQTFLMATNASCGSSTLYTLDVSNASAMAVGSSATCTVGLAIDFEGNAYGIDLLSDALVSIDTATGAALPVGPLGFRAYGVTLFDFDPSTGILFLVADDLDSGISGMYVVDTATGVATFTIPQTITYLAVALAQDIDTIFVDGFDGTSGRSPR